MNTIMIIYQQSLIFKMRSLLQKLWVLVQKLLNIDLVNI